MEISITQTQNEINNYGEYYLKMRTHDEHEIVVKTSTLSATTVLDIPDALIKEWLVKQGVKFMKETWQADLDYLVGRIQEESHAVLECCNTFKYIEMASHAERLKFLSLEVQRLIAARGDA